MNGYSPKHLGFNEKGTVFYAKHFRGINLEDLKNLPIVRRWSLSPRIDTPLGNAFFWDDGVIGFLC